MSLPPKFLALIVKLIIFNYCTSISRLLLDKQTLQVNEKDDIKIQAYARYTKYSKKKLI